MRYECLGIEKKQVEKLKTIDGSIDKTIQDLSKDVEKRGVSKDKVARIVVKELGAWDILSPSRIYEGLGIEQKRKYEKKELEDISPRVENNIAEESSAPAIEVANTGQQEAVPTTATAEPDELERLLITANNKIKELQLQTKPVPVAEYDVQHLKEQLEQKNNQIAKLESENTGATKDIKVNDSMKKDFALTVEKYNNIIQERVQEDDGESTFKFFVVNKTGYYIPIKFFIDFDGKNVSVSLDEKRLT